MNERQRATTSGSARTSPASRSYTLARSRLASASEFSANRWDRLTSGSIVQWEAYKRKTGLVQCTRCQRPGHGSRNCNMLARCNFCGDGHDSSTCPVRKSKLEALQNSMGTSNIIPGAALEVEIPSKCCNCNAEGHFASDPKCPRRLAYIQARCSRAQGGRVNAKVHVTAPTQSSISMQPGGITYADMFKSGKPTVSHSGNNFVLGPSDNSHHFGD